MSPRAQRTSNSLFRVACRRVRQIIQQRVNFAFQLIGGDDIDDFSHGTRDTSLNVFRCRSLCDDRDGGRCSLFRRVFRSLQHDKSLRTYQRAFDPSHTSHQTMQYICDRGIIVPPTRFVNTINLIFVTFEQLIYFASFVQNRSNTSRGNGTLPR